MKKRKIDPDKMPIYQYPFCARCKKPISRERLERAKKNLWLPLCEECEPYIKKQLEKCLPLMQKLFRR